METIYIEVTEGILKGCRGYITKEYNRHVTAVIYKEALPIRVNLGFNRFTEV